MDVISSPFVTIVLNIIATVLIAKGILDVKYKDTFIQLGNNIFAGLMTAGVATYSIFKMVELHKHAITSKTAQPVGTASQQTQPVFTTQQTGLPADK